MKYFNMLMLCLVLFAGCQGKHVRTYWNTHSIDTENIDAAQDVFIRFAQSAVKAPETEALDAMDVLFDQLSKDAVAYYIYAEWMDKVFYSPASPCRSHVLYGKAVERMLADGIFSEDELLPYRQKLAWTEYNRVGTQAIVPGFSQFDTRTLVLVLDLGCPSCREALETLAADPAWQGVRKVAIGLGYGPRPEVPAWEYFSSANYGAIFDIAMTPVYFVVAPGGIVECGYTPAL